MESGYVRYFNSANGKLFGFVVDEMGEDLFFHYSDGRIASLNETRDVRLVEATGAMQFPKKGDRLVFARSNNAKGPKARPWAFELQYNRVVESAKRQLTIDEAREYLTGMCYDMLVHTNTSNDYGTFVTIEKSEVRWFAPNGTSTAGKATFITTTKQVGENAPYSTHTESSVTVYAPDPKKFIAQSTFLGADLIGFRNVGTPRKIVKGIKRTVLWNGGWDDYVLDTNVRDLTDDEARKNLDSPFPTFEDEDKKTWLRCRFAPGLGNQNQAMEVLAHLGGGD